MTGIGTQLETTLKQIAAVVAAKGMAEALRSQHFGMLEVGDGTMTQPFTYTVDSLRKIALQNYKGDTHCFATIPDAGVTGWRVLFTFPDGSKSQIEVISWREEGSFKYHDVLVFNGEVVVYISPEMNAEASTIRAFLEDHLATKKP